MFRNDTLEYFLVIDEQPTATYVSDKFAKKDPKNVLELFNSTNPGDTINVAAFQKVEAMGQIINKAHHCYIYTKGEKIPHRNT